MVVLLILLLLFLWQYRKSRSYNPYDGAYSRSSYYDVAFCGREGCIPQVRRILSDAAGAGRLLEGRELTLEQDAFGKQGRDFPAGKSPFFGVSGNRPSERGPGAELILIHESGIYAFSSYQMEGSIAGNPAGRYWEQIFYHGWQPAARNYFYNSFLQNKRSLDAVRWALRDMPGVPCYSFAVFGPEGELWTQGNLGDGRWAVTLHGLGGAVAGIMRRNRRFLKPEQVEEICRRLKEGVG